LAELGIALGGVRCPHSNLRQGWHRERQFGLRNVRQDDCDPGGGRGDGDHHRLSWIFLVLSGLATGFSWICYFRALKLGNAAQVAPIDKLSVVMVAVIAALFLGERLSALNWIGVALIGIGAVLVAVQL
jgi:drug/metabolite transporter (DMT)-like permease